MQKAEGKNPKSAEYLLKLETEGKSLEVSKFTTNQQDFIFCQ